jgi:hypothetical protein
MQPWQGNGNEGWESATTLSGWGPDIQRLPISCWDGWFVRGFRFWELNRRQLAKKSRH